MNVGDALWDQRQALCAYAPRLGALRQAVNSPVFCQQEWFQLYALLCQFQPDLIIELGRFYGNSTALFSEYATKGDVSVLSVDWDVQRWEKTTVPRLNEIVAPAWYAPLQCLCADIEQVDLSPCIASVQRVFLFWDAHGYELAHSILGRIMPLLQDKAHLVVVHDIIDSRYRNLLPERAYHLDDGLTTYWTGFLYSFFPEIVAIYDFLSRNQISFQTVMHDIALLKADTARWTEVTRLYRDSGFGELLSYSSLLYFNLEHRSRPEVPLHFPGQNSGIQHPSPPIQPEIQFSVPELARAILKRLMWSFRL